MNRTTLTPTTQDHNVTENAQHQRQQRKPFAGGCTRGHKLRDVKMLRAHATSTHWQRKPATGASAAATTATATPVIDWKRRGSAARLTATGAEFHTLGNSNAAATAAAPATTVSDTAAADNYKSNLLAKIPANSTIVGSTGAMSSNLMNRSLTETSAASASSALANDSTTTTTTTLTVTDDKHRANESPAAVVDGGAVVGTDSRSKVKTVFSRAIDAFHLSDHCRGFLRDNALPSGGKTAGAAWPIWGVYCVRWRRSGDPHAPDNESKFVVHGIGAYSGIGGGSHVSI